MNLRTWMVATAVATPLIATATTALPLPQVTLAGPPAVDGVGGRLEARGCMEVASVVSVKPARASAELPVGYKPKSYFGLPGDATMIIGVTHCESGVLNGVPLKGSFVLGERMLHVEPRSAVGGHHFYSIGQVTDNEHIAAWLKSRNYPVQLDPEAYARAGFTSARGAGDGADVIVKLALPLPLPISSVSIWRDDSGGQSVLTKVVGSARSQIGFAHMTVDPQIPLGAMASRLTGSTKTLSLGMINRVDGYTATLTTQKTSASSVTDSLSH